MLARSLVMVTIFEFPATFLFTNCRRTVLGTLLVIFNLYN